MVFSKNPKSLPCSKLRGRARTPTAGGVRAPAEVGDFSFKERARVPLRSSKEGERCKERVRRVRRVKNSANLLVPRSLGHGSKTVLQDPLKSSP